MQLGGAHDVGENVIVASGGVVAMAKGAMPMANNEARAPITIILANRMSLTD